MTVLGALLMSAGGLAMVVGGAGFAQCLAGEARGTPSALATLLGGLAVVALGLYTLGAR